MDLGTPFQTLERVFTDFNVGRLLYLMTLAGVIALVNYKAGFTHHYDVSYQLSEIERLRNVGGDSLSQKKISALYDGVIEEMEARQKPIPERIENLASEQTLGLIVRILAVSFGFLSYFAYTLLPFIDLQERRSQTIGSGLLTIVLMGIGVIFPDVGGLGGTAAALIGVQFVVFVILAAYGNYRREY